DGHLTVIFEPHDLQPGDSLSFRVGLYDDAMPLPLTHQLHIKVGPSVVISKKTPGPPPPPPQVVTEDVKKGLPKFELLTEDGRKVLGLDTKRWADVPDNNETDPITKLDGGFI